MFILLLKYCSVLDNNNVYIIIKEILKFGLKKINFDRETFTYKKIRIIDKI